VTPTAGGRDSRRHIPQVTATHKSNHAPVSGESIYHEFLDRAGAGLHQVCMEATDADAFDAALRDDETQRRTRRAEGWIPAACGSRSVGQKVPACPTSRSAHSDRDPAFFTSENRSNSEYQR